MATSVWRRFSNIWVSGNLNLRKNAKITRDDQVVTITAATATLTPTLHGNGRTVNLDRAGGIAVTLPAASGSGDKYELIVVTTYTTAGTISCGTGDSLKGIAIMAGSTSDQVAPTVSGDNTITFNITTSGGDEGTMATFIDNEAGFWEVVVYGVGSGVAISPFTTV